MITERAILGPGERAPGLDLRAADGARYVLADALAAGLVLLVFFERECQACQTSLLFWDRAYEAYAGSAFQLWAVALDSEREAAAFYEKSGVSFPVLFGDRRSVEAYRLVSTPSHFLIGSGGVVLASFDAFDRNAWNAMINTVAACLGRPAIAIGPSEAPEFRPGCTIHV